MKEFLLEFVHKIPKYSVTITLDASLVVAAFMGIVIVFIVFIAGNYVKGLLFNYGDEAADELMELVNENEEGDATNSNDSNKQNNPSSPKQSNPSTTSSSGFRTPPVNNSKPFNSIKSLPKKGGSHNTSASSVATSAVNTTYDLEEFMARLHKYFFLINRIKDVSNHHDVKKRVMRINSNCELIFYKNFYNLTNKSMMNNTPNTNNAYNSTIVSNPKNNNNNNSGFVTPSKTPSKTPAPPITGYSVAGTPYIQLPLSELISCVNCDDDSFSRKYSSNFILEFKQKTLILRAALLLDNAYLIQGFEHLITRIKNDPNYLPSWKQRFNSSTGGSLISPQTKYTPTPVRRKNDDKSDDGLDYGTIYSYNSDEKIVDDIDARLARKRLSERNSVTSNPLSTPAK